MRYIRLFVIPILLTSVCGFLLHSAYIEVENRTIDQLNNQQLLAARQAATSIEDIFKHYLNLLNRLAGVEHIVSLDEQGKDLLRIFFETHAEDIKAIARLDAQGRMVYVFPADQCIVGADLSHYEHVRKIGETRQAIVSDVFASERGFQTIALHVPVLADGLYQGSVALLIPFDHIAKRYLEDIRLGKNGYAWMISQKGVELYCPVPGHVGNTVFENCKDFPSILAMAREMMEGKEGTTTYFYDKIRDQSIDSVKKHAVFLPVRLPGTFWSIVVATPEDEIVGIIQGFKNRWFLIIGVLFIALALYSYYLGRVFLASREEATRREAEEALRESEGKLRSTIQLYPIPTFVIGNDHRVMYWNKALEELSRIKADKVIGTKEHWRAFYNSARPCLADLLIDGKEEAIPDWYSGEYSRSKLLDEAYEATGFFPDLGDKGKWLHFTATDIRDSHGNVVGAIETLQDITERKRAEESLVSANQQLNDIIEFLPDATFVIDSEKKIIAWNRAIEEMTGFKKEDMIGKGDYACSIPFYGERRPHLLDLIDTSDEELESLYQYIKRKGRTIYAETFVPCVYGGKGAQVFATGAPLFDGHGNRVGAIESIRDITESKEKEDALRESRQQLEDIINFLPDATFVIDREGRVIAWNRAIEEMTGIEAREILGKGNYEYAIPFYGERRPILIDLVFNPKTEIVTKYFTLEKRDSTLAGESFTPALRGHGAFLFGTASLLRDSKGNIVGAIESIRDISERKRVEQALAEAEEKYRSIFENAIEGIFQTTLEGRVISANPAVASILGYDSPQEFINTITDLSLQLYVNPERHSDFLRLLEDRGTVQEFEVRFFRKDKSIAWISMNARAARNSKGDILYVEGTIQDITDRKMLESMLVQAQKMEAIGTLAGGIAHDFNNILGPIIGYSELTLQQIPEDSPLRSNMEQIILSGYRAKDLARQILTFGRRAGEERKLIQVGSIVKEAVDLLRPSLPSTIEIRRSIDPDAVFSTVMADPTHIHQVLMNLCTNAGHAMRDKGGVLEIALANIDLDPSSAGQYSVESGPYLRLSVSDTGHGMEEAVRRRIFEPYFTTKGPREGSGLGLAVVYGIVKNLSGGIAVSSEPGKGTTFHVLLPRSTAIQSSSAPGLSSLPVGTGHVLLVDDEKALVEVLKVMVEQLGYDVTARYSSIDTLEVFRSQPGRFDLVITDQTMPHMTGAELSREILKIRRDIPIILCTGFSEMIDEYRAREIGIKAYLMKPVTLRDLALAIQKALKRE